MMAAAESYFQNLSAGISAELRQEWEAEILEAEEQRHIDPSKMDIMCTRDGAGPTGIIGEPLGLESNVEKAIRLALSIEEKQ
jgi:hypothetical protein